MRGNAALNQPPELRPNRLPKKPGPRHGEAAMLLPPRIPKTGLPPGRSKPPRSGMSRDHRAFIRLLSCPIYPDEFPIEAHHLLRADQTRGMGRRAADRYAIPLSMKAHRELHEDGDEEAWLAAKGIDGRALAAALWRVSGDIDAARRAVSRSRGR